MPHPASQGLASAPSIGSGSIFLLTHTVGGRDGGSRSWAPAPDMGDLHRVQSCSRPLRAHGAWDNQWEHSLPLPKWYWKSFLLKTWKFLNWTFEQLPYRNTHFKIKCAYIQDPMCVLCCWAWKGWVVYAFFHALEASPSSQTFKWTSS